MCNVILPIHPADVEISQKSHAGQVWTKMEDTLMLACLNGNVEKHAGSIYAYISKEMYLYSYMHVLYPFPTSFKPSQMG